MTAEVTLYHNPRCSKSRETLKLLQDSGVETAVVRYLDTPPDAATITSILDMLGFSDARELMRRKEAVYSSLQLDNPQLTQEALIQTMIDNPVLIERPIAVAQGKARIGRPPEQVLEILNH